MKKIITCDLGATNVRIGLFECDLIPSLKEVVYLKTSELSSFSEVLIAVNSMIEADAYVFAVAGPVVEESFCNPPNIPWSVDLRSFNHKYFLINDFAAQGWALIADYNPQLPTALVGAGSGLGKAVLFKGEVITSEGGHADFPFISADEQDFSSFACERLSCSHLVYDDVVSGRGLELAYEFFKGEKASADKIDLSDSKEEVFCWFARMYGRACRNYVLETLAIGGLVVSGGIAIKNPGLIESKAFKESFLRSEKYSSILKSIEVRVLDREDTGLYGACAYGLRGLDNQG